MPHFSSTKTLLDDLLDTKESDNNDKIKNEEERACALTESEHELGKSKNIDITLNDMPCCSEHDMQNVFTRIRSTVSRRGMPVLS